MKSNSMDDKYPKKHRKQARLVAAQVAYLRSKGWKQFEIAHELGLTRPMVSRWLAPRGRSAEYLKVQLPSFDWSRVTREEEQLLKRMGDGSDESGKLTDLLAAYAGRRVRIEAHILPGEVRIDAGRDETGQNSFIAKAAGLIWKLLAPAKVIGVTWGETLSQLLASAQDARYASPFLDKQDWPLVVPLCGESLGAGRPSSLSSSRLAEGFGRLLTERNETDYLSLGMVPMFFPGPEAFDDGELGAARKLLSYSAAYRKIFVGDDGGADRSPLATRLDVILTSISRVNRPFGFPGNDDFNWITLKLSKLKQLIIGDLGGVPLAKPGLTPQETDLLNSLRGRWTGLQWQHVRDCANRASVEGNKTSGVIVLAKDGDRDQTVLQAVKDGLVNHLVVSEPLGKNLLKQLHKGNVPGN